MQRLTATGLDDVLRDVVAGGKPFLGICLGLQLLFEGSDEAAGVAGLGILRGRCVRFAGPLRTPQVGWNAVRRTAQGSPHDALGDGAHFYFVHSYHALASDPADVVAVADYGGPFVASVQRGQVFAAQFHPEKSGEAGLALIRAWLATGAS
jgi:glutamine amidotransferase